MDRDTLAHAFEPFYTTKPLAQGTGLGLSIVYGIVKQSGGYIWLYSELGEGTTVKMYLPETGSAPPPAEIERREVPVSSGRILIAEDDPTVRAMMVRALGEAGYLLVEATNGREALDLVTKDPSPFDLVITDVAMPQMNGRDWPSASRRLGRRSRCWRCRGRPTTRLCGGVCSTTAIPSCRSRSLPRCWWRGRGSCWSGGARARPRNARSPPERRTALYRLARRTHISPPSSPSEMPRG
jgi:hypothetical protein